MLEILRQRAFFIKRSFAVGWEWLLTVAGHFGALAILFAIVGVGAFYTLKLSHWWMGLFLAFVFLTVIFAEGSFRLWRDLDRSTSFPHCEIEVKKPFYFDTEAELDDEPGHRVILFDVRVTNREAAQRINLVFVVETVWNPRRLPDREINSKLFGHHLGSRRKYTERVLPEIVEIDPASSRDGCLVFDGRPDDPWIVFVEDSTDVAPREDCRFVMTVKDHVSGRSVSFDVPGTWSS